MLNIAIAKLQPPLGSHQPIGFMKTKGTGRWVRVRGVFFMRYLTAP